jgi:hypothetical protein
VADVRGMTLGAVFIVDHLPATAADLAVDATAALVDDGSGQLSYTDSAVPGQTDLYYRLVTVDAAGNPSRASPLVQARAYDAARPDPPTWNTPTASADGLALSWSAADASLSCLVQRRARGEAAWSKLGRWPVRGAYAYTDATRVDGIVYEYRLLVMDGAGRTNAEFNVLER